MFTRNATEAINLVAYTWARANLREGDAIVLSHMEHHANVVPWHMLAAERGSSCAGSRSPTTSGSTSRTSTQLLDGAKLLAISAMSNVLGTINEIRPLADAAHAHDALVLVDACQYVPHVATDVQAWDADFVAFSAHKMLGPSGIGALWARYELLDDDAAVPRRRRDDPRRAPRRLHHQRRAVEVRGRHACRSSKRSASAPPSTTSSALGMDARTRPRDAADARTRSTRCSDRFGDSLTIYGPLDISVRGGAVSFLFDGIHAHDISQVLDEDAVCVRAGHHCAKPLMRQLGVPGDEPGVVLRLQRRGRRRRARRGAGEGQKFFADLRRSQR